MALFDAASHGQTFRNVHGLFSVHYALRQRRAVLSPKL